MLRDLGLLLWLRGRLLRGSAAYWLGTVGYDLDERALSNRVYGVYLVLIGGVWFLLMWAWAVDQAASLGAMLSPAQRASAALALPFALLGAGTLAAMHALRESPLKLSAPESAYLAASPVSRPALALVGFFASLARVGPGPALLIALAGTALAQGGGSRRPRTGAGWRWGRCW